MAVMANVTLHRETADQLRAMSGSSSETQVPTSANVIRDMPSYDDSERFE
jgi:hypothetical protein